MRGSENMEKYDIVFESENIVYIKLSESLIEDYLKMVNDPDIAKMIRKKVRFFTHEEELEWVKEKLNDNAYIFSMIEKNTGEFIGNIEIMNINNNIGEIGICITANKQDKHYGTDKKSRYRIPGYSLPHHPRGRRSGRHRHRERPGGRQIRGL